LPCARPETALRTARCLVFVGFTDNIGEVDDPVGPLPKQLRLLDAVR
jgi:hypothetical protein